MRAHTDSPDADMLAGEPAVKPDSVIADWYARVPGVTSAVGALILDHQHNVMLAQPTYKPAWVFVGGTVDADEAPSAAMARELAEELGTVTARNTRIGRLLVTDWVPRRRGWDRPMHHLVFDCGQVDPSALNVVRLPAHELQSIAFVAIAEAKQLMEPHESRRLELAIQAKRLGTHIYAEGGYPSPARSTEGRQQ